MSYKTTAFDLKLALLQYYRFKRQCITVDEYCNADIVADSFKEIIEVEVKISKYDLLNGEKKKYIKHHNYKAGHAYGLLRPNKYMFCVPENLIETAKKYANELNPKYGVIRFDTERFERDVKNGIMFRHYDYIGIAKSAKPLHNEYNEKVKLEMAKRVSAKLVALTRQIYEMRIQNEQRTQR